MSHKETFLWERLQKARQVPLQANWLGTVYSPQLSKELRIALSEHLGQLAKEGWPTIALLIKTHNLQPELIKAAGLCHQPAARDWLISLLDQETKFHLEVIQALACWGALLPNHLLEDILKAPNQAMRIAGLDLLSFKAHHLNEKELLQLTKELLVDIRDPIVIRTINILQRRDEVVISKKIGELAINGSEAAAHAALMALGSIGTKDSQTILSILSEQLPNGNRRALALKQLKHQYRLIQTV